MNLKEMLLKREIMYNMLDENLTYKEKEKYNYNIEFIDRLIKDEQGRILIKDKRKFNPVSIRLAMIVVFEEFLKCKNPKRKEHSYNSVFIESNSRFSLSTRNTEKWNDLNIIHPKNPCTLFENERKRLSYYYRALHKIVDNAWWIVDQDIVTQSLEEIKSDVKICLN